MRLLLILSVIIALGEGSHVHAMEGPLEGAKPTPRKSKYLSRSWEGVPTRPKETPYFLAAALPSFLTCIHLWELARTSMESRGQFLRLGMAYWNQSTRLHQRERLQQVLEKVLAEIRTIENSPEHIFYGLVSSYMNHLLPGATTPQEKGKLYYGLSGWLSLLIDNIKTRPQRAQLEENFWTQIEFKAQDTLELAEEYLTLKVAERLPVLPFSAPCGQLSQFSFMLPPSPPLQRSATPTLALSLSSPRSASAEELPLRVPDSFFSSQASTKDGSSLRKALKNLHRSSRGCLSYLRQYFLGDEDASLPVLGSPIIPSSPVTSPRHQSTALPQLSPPMSGFVYVAPASRGLDSQNNGLKQRLRRDDLLDYDT